MKSRREYIIPFVGLKIGFHDFEFEIRDSFFEDRDYSIIHKGNVLVNMRLEKKERMMIAEFSIRGTVHTNCDRCNDPLEVPAIGDYKLIYKFGLEESDDEMLLVLHPDAYEIDLNDTLYELITVSLPTRLIHKKGECNEEMLALLQKYGAESDEDEEDWDDDEEDWDEEETMKWN